MKQIEKLDALTFRRLNAMQDVVNLDQHFILNSQNAKVLAIL